MQSLKNIDSYQLNIKNKNRALIDEINFIYKENHPFENLKNVNLHFLMLEYFYGSKNETHKGSYK